MSCGMSSFCYPYFEIRDSVYKNLLRPYLKKQMEDLRSFNNKKDFLSGKFSAYCDIKCRLELYTQGRMKAFPCEMWEEWRQKLKKERILPESIER